ncbi:uncharacterized protein [Watersipora subatra]|uniref:uncharacterized protein n=1 Tax=Watersipora subatra TaxID=2589382 RepID=UPI00355B24E2
MLLWWICCLAAVSIQTEPVQAEDYEYVLLYLDNYVAEEPTQKDVEVYLASRADDAIVTISNPNGNLFSPITFSLSLNTVKNLTLTSFVRQTDDLNDRAIKVVGDSDLIVYALNRNTYSTDGFTAFRVDQVGEEYYAMAYIPEYNTQIGIVAVEDGETQVDITLSASGQARWLDTFYREGDVISFTLARKYRTARLKSEDGKDLTGTRVVANKKVSVFTGNVRTKVDGTSRDHLVDQLPPVVQWGFQYYTARTPGRTPDRPDVVRIVAHLDSTEVQVRGNIEEMFTINSGEYRELLAYGPLFIDSGDKSVMVAVITSSQSQDDQYKDIDAGDPSMIIIPAVGQYSADFVFSTPLYIKPQSSSSLEYDISVLVIVKTTDIAGLSLNGQPLTANWFAITNTEYSTGEVSVQNGQSYMLQHSNSSARFMALLYGSADRESFYFPIAVGKDNVNVVTPVEIQGNQGEKGDVGVNGIAGSTGSSGVRGPTGEAGSLGSQGSKGEPGDKGVAGSPSAFGAPGATGATGAKGSHGVLGVIGAMGSTGASGGKGSSGKQGPDGDVGIPGAAGMVGAIGDAGPTGLRGFRGPSGAKGDKGSRGPQGVTGPPGVAGEKGYMAIGSCDNKCSVRGSSQPATCQVTYGTYSHLCSCPPGFHLTVATPNICVDIDECALEFCSHGCTNFIGSYSCSCPSGYRLEQNICVDLDECTNSNNPCGSEVCVNSIGSYLCLGTAAPAPLLLRSGLQALIDTDAFIAILCLLIFLTILVIITASCLLTRHRRRYRANKPNVQFMKPTVHSYPQTPVYMAGGYYR